MQRSWMVLLLVGTLVLAGCSGTFGQSSPDYPSGWGEQGMTNKTQAVDTADASIAGADFVEQHAYIHPAPPGASGDQIVSILVVSVDRDSNRLLNEQRFYLVNDSLATRVVDEGVDVLASESPVEEQVTYLDERGAYRYQNLSGRSPSSKRLPSGNYSQAIDQPLPAIYATQARWLATGEYSNPRETEDGITYDLRNVSANPLQNATGHVTVRSNGLVRSFDISQDTGDGRLTVAYQLRVRDVSVSKPSWAG